MSADMIERMAGVAALAERSVEGTAELVEKLRKCVAKLAHMQDSERAAAIPLLVERAEAGSASDDTHPALGLFFARAACKLARLASVTTDARETSEGGPLASRAHGCFQAMCNVLATYPCDNSELCGPVRDDLLKLARKLTEAVDDDMDLANAAIPALSKVVGIFRALHGPFVLSTAHPDLLQLCLTAKQYATAANALAEPILDVQAAPKMTLLDVRRYFYYSGRVWATLKEFDRAIEGYTSVALLPDAQGSAVTDAAYRQLLLVSLIHHGRRPTLPDVVERVLQSRAETYERIANSFVRGRAALTADLDLSENELRTDGNWGLASQIVDAFKRHKVLALRRAYVTLPIADIARHLGEEGDGAAGTVERLLFDMLRDDQVELEIDPATSMVRFFDQSTTKIQSKKLVQQAQALEEMLDVVRGMDLELAVSPNYIAAVSRRKRDTSAMDAFYDRKSLDPSSA